MLAQVTLHSRGVYVWSLLVLAVAYLQRGVGDVTKTWVTWLSPLGWAEKAAPFGAMRWWTLLIPWPTPPADQARPPTACPTCGARTRPAGTPTAGSACTQRVCGPRRRCVGCTVAAAGHRHRAVACPSRFPRCAGSPDRIRPFDLEEALFLANAQH